MSIRFPKSCKTKTDRSAYAQRVALIGWERRRATKPPHVWIGAISFHGPLAGGEEMRLDFFAVDGERKWTAKADGILITDRLSERGVLRLVKAVLRSPRTTDPCVSNY